MGDNTDLLISKAKTLMDGTGKYADKQEKWKWRLLAALNDGGAGQLGDYEETKKAFTDVMNGYKVACDKLNLHSQMMMSHLKLLNSKIKLKDALSFFKVQKSLDEAKEAAKKLEKAAKHVERMAIAGVGLWKESQKAVDATLKHLKNKK